MAVTHQTSCHPAVQEGNDSTSRFAIMFKSNLRLFAIALLLLVSDIMTVEWENLSHNFYTLSSMRSLGTTTTTLVKRPSVVTAVGPSENLILKGRKYIMRRKHAYNVANLQQNWKWRGVGYLYNNQNISLVGEVQLPTRTSSDAGTGINEPTTIPMGENIIKIWNVHLHASAAFDDCHKLTIWIRINGPEIMANRAKPVPSTASPTGACYWEFPFNVTKPGKYHVDAKLLMWNGHAPVHFHENPVLHPNQEQVVPAYSQCLNVFPGNHIGSEAYEKASQNTAILGFKLYTPISACCEICRRLEGCKYWATPPRELPLPQNFQNGCEFYFASSASKRSIPTTNLMSNIVAEQSERLKEDTARLAIQEQMPTTRQRRLRTAQVAFNYHNQQLTPMVWGLHSNNSTPHFNTADEHRRRRRLHTLSVPAAWGSSKDNNPEVAQFLGCGWSYHFHLEFPCLSGDLDDSMYIESADFVVVPTVNDEFSQKDRLPLCTLQDEHLSVFANGTQRALPGRWVREDWSDRSLCPTEYERDPAIVDFPQDIGKFDPEYPHCYWRDNLQPLNKGCNEMNCPDIKDHSKWLASPLQNDTEWMGVWRNYDCDYMEFTNDELSECFQRNKISSISTGGASIGRMLHVYLNQRLVDVQLYNATNPDARSATISTLAWPHMLWHKSTAGWKEELENMPSLMPSSTNSEFNVSNSKHEFYVLSPFFITSEREPYVQADRAMELAEIMERMLTPKGYRLINSWDLSSAFGYDTSGQADGLHIVGPPMKAILTKVFHHMCSTVVEGSPV